VFLCFVCMWYGIKDPVHEEPKKYLLESSGLVLLVAAMQDRNLGPCSFLLFCFSVVPDETLEDFDQPTEFTPYFASLAPHF